MRGGDCACVEGGETSDAPSAPALPGAHGGDGDLPAEPPLPPGPCAAPPLPPAPPPPDPPPPPLPLPLPLPPLPTPPAAPLPRPASRPRAPVARPLPGGAAESSSGLVALAPSAAPLAPGWSEVSSCRAADPSGMSEKADATTSGVGVMPRARRARTSASRRDTYSVAPTRKLPLRLMPGDPEAPKGDPPRRRSFARAMS
mmetsp:Transcript_18512/g.70220  ORF Transcript_18512/g.70220 Transcript_18512/m.70220 type:complete len:200 (-) Transcript_18512:665-1264(-)